MERISLADCAQADFRSLDVVTVDCMAKNFQWSPNGPLPRIEEHSLRKLDVLQNYLDRYFDTVVSDPRMDRLNITLVDGFCGGGAYQHGERIEYGSPIILLQSVERARERLNTNRGKPLEINAHFVLIDNKSDHIASLEERIRDAGFGDQIGSSITLITGNLADELPDILKKIRAGQRAGRSIFVLDQCGYCDVPMEAVRSIFATLDRPEILLTFAIDALLNYLREESGALETFRQFGADNEFIEEWNAKKADGALGRLTSQMVLMAKIQGCSGANFFTPFMLWSRTDNRWMMIAHLSRHQAARDKMLGVHWDSQNSFRHIGKGSFFLLGFDTRRIEAKDSLFNFTELDRTTMNGELVQELPREIAEQMTEGGLSVEALLARIGNRTAATNLDICTGVKQLVRDREIEVRSKDGRQKRVGSQVELSDQLILPAQMTLRRYIV